MQIPFFFCRTKIENNPFIILEKRKILSECRLFFVCLREQNQNKFNNLKKKTMKVKKITASVNDAQAVPQVLDNEGVSFQKIDIVNW